MRAGSRSLQYSCVLESDRDPHRILLGALGEYGGGPSLCAEHIFWCSSSRRTHVRPRTFSTVQRSSDRTRRSEKLLLRGYPPPPRT
nr:MAG TPA: hypothetical protein [Caudoviricetes sp.]